MIQLRPMTTAMTKTITAPILPNVCTNHSQTGRAFSVISHSLVLRAYYVGANFHDVVVTAGDFDGQVTETLTACDKGSALSVAHRTVSYL